MRMARGRTCLWIKHFLSWPSILVNRKFMKIINSVKAVITTKDVNMSNIHNSSMPVSRWRRRIVDWKNFSPLLGVKVKFKKIITSVCSVISTKNIEIVIQSYWSIQTSRTWRVAFIILLVVNHMPVTRFFQQMMLSASDYVWMLRSFLHRDITWNIQWVVNWTWSLHYNYYNQRNSNERRQTKN